ncbi:MAG: 2-phosphosulfolactate phosphatase [Ignavibacteriaceae bacterium]
MKVNVLFSPVNADELYFANKTTVVIDVLRASSTIINALSNGAKEVIPVATVEFAVKVSGGMFGGPATARLAMMAFTIWTWPVGDLASIPFPAK